MRINELKRHFLAACPVIGPHANIELHLMHVRLKGVTFLDLYSEGNTDTDRERILQEKSTLDKAVARGLLISLEMPVTDWKTGTPYALWHYCFPEHENLMKELAALNVEWKKTSPYNESSASLKQRGSLLGYRQRDIFLFDFLRSIQQTFGINFYDKIAPTIFKLNLPSIIAYQQKMLLQGGFPEEFLTTLKAAYEAPARQEAESPTPAAQ